MGRIERLLQWTLDFIIRTPVVFWSCILANLVGTVLGGVFWYGAMLARSPLWAAPFIPDCPLAALLGSVALLGLWARKRWPLLLALAAFAGMKYGAWTIGYWLCHWANTGSLQPLAMLMVVTHIGLFCEGLLLLPFVRSLALPGRVGIVAWFALSVYVDYGLGYHPPLISSVPFAFALWMAIGLTVVIGGIVVGYGGRGGGNEGRKASLETA